jgi:hypothetical protein
MNFIRGGSLEKQLLGGGGGGGGGGANRDSRGGSLERQFKAAGGWSDSEYGRMLGSPMASRKNNSGSGGSPAQTPSPNSPASGKRDPVFGSRSLPKGTSSLNYGLMLDRLQQKRQQQRQQQQQQHNSLKNDGSMSDSNYATYSDLKHSWMQPASTYATSVQDHYMVYDNGETASSFSGISSYNDPMGSNESLNSVSSSIQQARANSLTKARLMMHQRNVSPRSSLKRNNNGGMSERSFGAGTNSETEYYGIPTQRENSAGVIARFKSSPMQSSSTSPTKSVVAGNKTYASLPYYGNQQVPPAVTASNLSLVSNSTGGIYQQSQLMLQQQHDAKTDADINQLKKELLEEHRKVGHLTSQLATNSHVVSAFEQSLGNMTSRLHDLTMTAERKDTELDELRMTIDRLRQSGADAGLISSGCALMRQKSTDSVISAVSSVSEDEGGGGKSSKSKKKSLGEEGGPKRSGWLRHSFTKAFSRSNSQSCKGMKGMNGHKGGSVSDVEGDSITQRLYEQEKRQEEVPQRIPPEPPIRSASAASGSIGYLQYPPVAEQAVELVSELQRQLMEKESQLTETRLEALSSAHQLESLKETVSRMRNELVSLKTDNEKLNEVSARKSLHSSRSSLNNSSDQKSSEDSNNACDESSGDSKLRSVDERLEAEMSNNYDRDTLEGEDDDDKRLSVTMSEVSVLSGPSSLDLSCSTDPTNKDGGKLVTVSVSRGETGNEMEVRLGTISVSGRCSWDLLDSLVQRLFKEYVMRIDPASNLGLNTDSIASYVVGEVCRGSSDYRPEYLPYGYLVGNTTDIRLNLKRSVDGNCVDALAFETLTPKSIAKRYVSLLMEHRRIILSGPAGTGKTFMAKRLANYLLHCRKASASNSSQATTPTTPTAESMSSIEDSVLLFSVDMNNVTELKQFLSRISAEASSAAENSNMSSLPKVIILDNLHHAGTLDEVFNGALTAKFSLCPYIIGTLNQTSGCGSGVANGALSPSSTTNLQLRHNFRWVLCANHIEPAKGFLGRYLRQKLLEVEARTRLHDGEMAAVLEWVARVHAKLNKLIESHSSSDVTLGPGPFLDCPTDDIKRARSWFLRLWNMTLVPSVRDTVREGLQMYGNRAAKWEDPRDFVLSSWPWTDDSGAASEILTPITAKDVGYDSSRPSSGESAAPPRDDRDNGGSDDPLFNMLMHLQEAAAANSAEMVDGSGQG